MPEQPQPEPPRPTANISRKLGITATTLIILPVILPWPLWGLENLWIGPLDYAAWQQCRSFYCPAAAHWETLATYMILGPSMLLAAASFLLGWIGLLRSRRYPISQGNRPLFWASFWCGILWFIILEVFLQIFLAVAGGTL